MNSWTTQKFSFIVLMLFLFSSRLSAQSTITSFSPTSGAVGTLIKISGSALLTTTSVNIGSQPAIIFSKTGTEVVAMVMPGSITGVVSVTTTFGTVNTPTNFQMNAASYPSMQQGSKLVGSGYSTSAKQGCAVDISADGNTAIVGGYADNAVWIYNRSGNTWSQQGTKLTVSGLSSLAYLGASVALSADGNTAIAGIPGYNSTYGAAVIFTRNTSNVWSQQGGLLAGTGGSASSVMGVFQGTSVDLSADGNTAVIGGNGDYSLGQIKGAAWVFTRSGSTWTQQGSKLVGTGSVGSCEQGTSVALSTDGNTAIVGGPKDVDLSSFATAGAAWVFTRSGSVWTQQGSKLVGTGFTGDSQQGTSVALSADGNIAMIGGPNDNTTIGAAWVFARNGSTWTQQGNKLIGSGAGNANQGTSVALSADGKTAMIGGWSDNNNVGATWVFTYSNTWNQMGNKLNGTGTIGTNNILQGVSIALSADGRTAIVGGSGDNSNVGAAWVYVSTPPSVTSFSPSSGPPGTLITVSGNFLDNPTSVTVGGKSAIVLSSSTTYVKALIMPGTTSGTVTVSNPDGTVSASGNFTITPTPYPASSGGKVVGSWAYPPTVYGKGYSVSLSADGNRLLVGGPTENSNSGAAWILTPNGNWGDEGTKLLGSDAVGRSNYQGISVAVSADGNTAIVGGRGDNGNAGAAWIYAYINGTWIQQGSKLVGTGAVGNAFQGISVSISADGNTAIIGGSADNSNAGAAWIFKRKSNIWTQQGNKLVGSGAIGNAKQGTSVALSADGNTAIIGGNGDNGNIGATWIYVQNNGAWTQQGSKMVGTGAVGNAQQGYSVAINADGTTAMVGGSQDSSGAGAIWVYIRNGSTWSQQGGKLKGTGNIGNASLGSSVSVSADGNTAVVGGPTDNANQGAIWVYTRNSVGTWSQGGNKLLGSLVYTGHLGFSVSLQANGSTAMAGGPYDDGNHGGVWSFGTGLTTVDSFGPVSGPPGTLVTITGSNFQNNINSVTIGGTTAVIVSTTLSSLVVMVMPGTTGGAVELNTSTNGILSASGNFTITSTPTPTTQLGNKLVASGTVGAANLGSSLALSADGSTAIIGANVDNGGMGAAFIYTRSGNTWIQQAKLVGTGAVGASFQGGAVAISADGNTAVIGGLSDDGSKGAAWIFTRNNGVWTQQSNKLTSGSTSGSRYGYSVALSADGNTAMVGAISYNSNAGAAFVYTRGLTGAWSLQNLLQGSGGVGNTFQGSSVSLSADGNTALVGGYGDNSGIGGTWVFTRSGGTWTQQGSKLVGTNVTGTIVYQGQSVSLSADGNSAIVGGYYDNSQIGAAWIFKRSGNTWTQQGSKLVGSGAIGTSRQGYAVSMSIDGNLAIAGGYLDNSFQGAAWIYRRNGNSWTQQGSKLVGTGAVGSSVMQGSSVALSADGTVAMVGGSRDNADVGAVWIYKPNYTWTGGTSNDWGTATNWSSNAAPGNIEQANIPAGTPYSPNLNNANYNVNGLTLSTGQTLTLGTGNLTLTGNLSNTGTITGSGKIILAGTIQQTLSGKGAISNLELNNSAGATISTSINDTLNVTGALTLTSGTLTTNSRLALKSTATGTARVAAVTGGSVSGSVIVERFIGIPSAKRAWRFMTAPLKGSDGLLAANWQNDFDGNTVVNTPGIGTNITGPSGTIGADFTSVDYSMKKYNVGIQTLSGVTNISTETLFDNNTAPIPSNKPFFIFVRGDKTIQSGSSTTTLKAIGQLQTGTQTFNETLSANQMWAIGNPYASPIDFAKISSSSNILNRFYVWDPNLNSLGAYVIVDGTSGNYTSNIPTSSQNQYIQSGQAFYLQKDNSPSSAVSLTFEEDDKSDNTVNNVFKTSSNQEELNVTLYGLSDHVEVFDGVVLQRDANYADSIDEMDAPKMQNFSENLSIFSHNKDLSIERRTAVTNNNDTVQLNFTNSRAMNYQLSIEVSNCSETTTIYLRDAYLNSLTPISAGDITDYTFSVTNASDSWNPYRFSLVFAGRMPSSNEIVLTGSRDKGAASLEWTVPQESGMVYYELEKSTNSKQYSKVYTSTAQRNGKTDAKYSYQDQDALATQLYYRVKGISIERDATYSNTISIAQASNDNGNISIFPNPVENHLMNLQLLNMAVNQYTVNINTLDGKAVYTTVLQHDGHQMIYSIRLPDLLAAGMYHVEVSYGKATHKKGLAITVK